MKFVWPFAKKKEKAQEISEFEQKRQEAIDRVKAEFFPGDVCYCNGFCHFSCIFMNADAGIFRGILSNGCCDVYLTEKEEIVEVLPELVFHTKEEALNEREEHRKKFKQETSDWIKEHSNTDARTYIKTYGIRSSYYLPDNLEEFKFQEIEITFGHIDEFRRACFVVEGISSQEGKETLAVLFEKYCKENSFNSSSILDIRIIDVAGTREELEEREDDIDMEDDVEKE